VIFSIEYFQKAVAFVVFFPNCNALNPVFLSPQVFDLILKKGAEFSGVHNPHLLQVAKNLARYLKLSEPKDYLDKGFLEDLAKILDSENDVSLQAGFQQLFLLVSPPANVVCAGNSCLACQKAASTIATSLEEVKTLAKSLGTRKSILDKNAILATALIILSLSLIYKPVKNFLKIMGRILKSSWIFLKFGFLAAIVIVAYKLLFGKTGESSGGGPGAPNLQCEECKNSKSGAIFHALEQQCKKIEQAMLKQSLQPPTEQLNAGRQSESCIQSKIQTLDEQLANTKADLERLGIKVKGIEQSKELAKQEMLSREEIIKAEEAWVNSAHQKFLTAKKALQENQDLNANENQARKDIVESEHSAIREIHQQFLADKMLAQIKDFIKQEKRARLDISCSETFGFLRLKMGLADTILAAKYRARHRELAKAERLEEAIHFKRIRQAEEAEEAEAMQAEEQKKERLREEQEREAAKKSSDQFTSFAMFAGVASVVGIAAYVFTGNDTTLEAMKDAAEMAEKASKVGEMAKAAAEMTEKVSRVAEMGKKAEAAARMAEQAASAAAMLKRAGELALG
jgi:hypothetical protein